MPLLPIQNTKRSASNRLLILLISITVLAFSVEAQKPRKSSAGIGVLAPAAAAATQCHNGALAAPVSCSGTNYKSGALVKSSSHYFEGDSIPYQIGLSATAGSAS